MNVETSEVLNKALEAQQYLSELKGISQTIPNQGILLNILPIQEAKDSSEIENIVTTSDALYKAVVEKAKRIEQTTKEVQRYTIFFLQSGSDQPYIQASLYKNKSPER